MLVKTTRQKHRWLYHTNQAKVQGTFQGFDRVQVNLRRSTRVHSRDKAGTINLQWDSVVGEKYWSWVANEGN